MLCGVRHTGQRPTPRRQTFGGPERLWQGGEQFNNPFVGRFVRDAHGAVCIVAHCGGSGAYGHVMLLFIVVCFALPLVH